MEKKRLTISERGGKVTEIRILSDTEMLKLLTNSTHQVENRPKTDEQKRLQSIAARGKRPWNEGKTVVIPKRRQTTVGFKYHRNKDPLCFIPVAGNGWNSVTSRQK